MGNRDLKAARRYHEGTKHPGGDLLNSSHRYTAADRPQLYKVYQQLDLIPLPLEKDPVGVSALSAIAADLTLDDVGSGEERLPDVETLARLLYFSAGITKHLQFPWGEMAFRAASCTGALYHIELYLVCRDLPGLDAGVYHFDPRENGLRRLREGDYRQVLVWATGSQPAVARAPAVLVYSDVFWRNAVKYQARAYRHAFWDSGTILSHSLAVASVHDLPAQIVLGFVDEEVNRLLDLDVRREAALALLPVGYAPDAPPPAPEVAPLGLEPRTVPDRSAALAPILEMHEASSLPDADQVRAWRRAATALELPEPSGQLFPLEPPGEGALPEDPLEPVIVRRGSTRRFFWDPLTFRQLSTALQRAFGRLPADFLPAPDARLSHAYLVVNAVEGLPPGAYVYHPGRAALELLREGAFRTEAGYLALNQALGADAGVDIFFLTDLGAVLDALGNRGYRAAQLDASVTAGRLYLAAYAQSFGATGLTFFDDAVTDFFPRARDKSVMFLIALGQPAPRRPR